MMNVHKKWSSIVAVMLLGVMLAVVPVGAEEEEEIPDDWEALDLDLPDPSYMGTPLNYWSEHLEITFSRREEFKAPPGTTNVALEKPVEASARPTTGRLEWVTNGDKSAADDNYVELPEGLQYVQIDLEDVYDLQAILVWRYHLEERVYFDAIVQIADDPDFTENVVTLFNNDHDNSSGLGVGEDPEYIENYEGRLINARGHQARYVRLYSNGNTTDDRNHFLEVEVWALPVD